jgi:hypothetical protein
LLGEHPRFPDNGRFSVLADHAQELFRFRRGKPYAQRQLLLDLDPSVEPYLAEDLGLINLEYFLLEGALRAPSNKKYSCCQVS